ncbi:alpha/beta hydrolase [Kitasatospora viridis]
MPRLRMRPRLVLGPVLAAALLTLGVSVPAVARAPGGGSAWGGGLAWGGCPAGTPGADGTVPPRDPREQCAVVAVPRDYRDPAAGTIRLAVSRIRTADPGQRRGVLLVVPGGPGGSGLDYPSRMAGLLPAAVLRSYDLVGFDERGVGNSAPVHCDLPAADRAAAVIYPFPAADGSIAGNLAYAREVADRCAAAGADQAGVSTANSARDIDRIRAALGLRRISYLGSSYGTYLGEVYATLFPDRTDRVVLDSVVPPGGEQQALGMVGLGAEQSFPDLAAWLAAQDAALHFGSTPAEVRATYFRLAAKLDAAPVGRLTGNAFRTLTYASLVGKVYYPLAARAWQLAAGQAAPAAGQGTARPTASPTAIPTVLPDNFVAAQDAVLCGDSAWPRDPGYYAARTAADRIRYPLTNGMPGNVWPCAFWHGEPGEPPVRVGSTPGPRNVLLLQNLRDPDTPYAGARQTLAAFGRRAAMASFDASGHGMDFTDPAVAAPFTRFLLTGLLPEGG